MRRTLALLLWILFAPVPATGQDARIGERDVVLYAAPGGAELGNIVAATAVEAGAERDGWREITIAGWIWARSVRADRRPGFDLVVGASNGENLRAAPNEEILARLRRGTLLEELGREGQWVRVRRTGWIRSGGLAPATETKGAAAETVDTSAAAAPDNNEIAGADEGRELPPAITPGQPIRAGRAGAGLLDRPGGDTLARVPPLANLEILERQGDWARVRVEGWVPLPALETPADSSTVLTGLPLEVLRSNPEHYRGRLVEWEIQYIASHRAEKIRTDFEEGEPFILARPPGDQPGFIYIAVKEAQLPRIRELAPLQRITILARVRTGRSRQMAAPVLDLIEIR